jgi:sec-independent protein translocase protein TatA
LLSRFTAGVFGIRFPKYTMHSLITTSLGFLQNLSPVQILLVLFIILLLFGAKRLPELGRGLGKFVKEFKKTTHDIEEDIRSSIEDEPPVRAKPEEKKVETKIEPRKLGTEP